MADAVERLTFTGEAQLYGHVFVFQLEDKYKTWDELRAHQRMWLGRVGKQPWAQWDDMLLAEFKEAIRALERVQEDEARAIAEVQNKPG